eukprot:3183054-Rhodomonas_salina.2
MLIRGRHAGVSGWGGTNVRDHVASLGQVAVEHRDRESCAHRIGVLLPPHGGQVADGWENITMQPTKNITIQPTTVHSTSRGRLGTHDASGAVWVNHRSFFRAAKAIRSNSGEIADIL